MIILSHHCIVSEYNMYIAGVDWPFIRITDCQRLLIEMIQ